MRILPFYLLLLLPALSGRAQETALNYVLIPAGTSEESAVRYDHLRQAGFRLSGPPDSARQLLVADVYAFSRALRRQRGKLTFHSAAGASAFSEKELRQTFLSQYLSSFRSQHKKAVRRRQRIFRRVWKGKDRRLKYDHPFVISLPPESSREVHDWQISFETRREPFATLEFGQLQIRRMDYLPWIRENECVPFNRWTHFLKGKIRGPRYIKGWPRYIPVKVDRDRKSFTMHFAHNQTDYDPAVVAAMRSFLEQEDLGIARVRIAGYASVEGDSLNNRRLMEERARVLSAVLNPYSDIPVDYKVEVEENWPLFERQVQKEGWAPRSRQAWKAYLQDDSVRTALEPWLALQRTAKIYLSTYTRRTDAEVLEGIWSDFIREDMKNRRARPGTAEYTKSLGRMLSVREYLRTQVKAGHYPLDTLMDFVIYEDYNEYNLYALFEEEARADTLSGHARYLAHLLGVAYETALNRYAASPSNKIRQSDLLYVQQRLFHHIDRGTLAPEVIYGFPVPDDDKFVNLKLNYLGFMEQLRQEGRLDAAESPGVEPEVLTRAVKDSRYYYLLSRIMKDALTQGLRAVTYRSDWMLEFDIADFLGYNLYFWDPWENDFLDDEIGVEEMERLLGKLRRVRKKLCEDDIVWLEAMFHLKVLQSGSLRPVEDKRMFRAITYLDRYYRRIAPFLSAGERRELAQQLMAGNTFCYFNEMQQLGDYLVSLSVAKAE